MHTTQKRRISLRWQLVNRLANLEQLGHDLVMDSRVHHANQPRVNASTSYHKLIGARKTVKVDIFLHKMRL